MRDPVPGRDRRHQPDVRSAAGSCRPRSSSGSVKRNPRSDFCSSRRFGTAASRAGQGPDVSLRPVLPPGRVPRLRLPERAEEDIPRLILFSQDLLPAREGIFPDHPSKRKSSSSTTGRETSASWKTSSSAARPVGPTKVPERRHKHHRLDGRITLRDNEQRHISGRWKTGWKVRGKAARSFWTFRPPRWPSG